MLRARKRTLLLAHWLPLQPLVSRTLLVRIFPSLTAHCPRSLVNPVTNNNVLQLQTLFDHWRHQSKRHRRIPNARTCGKGAVSVCFDGFVIFIKKDRDPLDPSTTTRTHPYCRRDYEAAVLIVFR